MSRSLLWATVVLFCCAIGVALAARQESAASAAARQVAYLKASNPGMFDHFGEGGALDGHIGNAVAVRGGGTTIAVGAQHESSNARGINGDQNNDAAYNAGAVYVFSRVGNTWVQQAYVKASNAGNGGHFGNSIALSGDGNTMAVGAFWESSAATGVNGNQDDNSIPQAGAVYVFVRRGNTWTQQAYIKASNTGNAGQDGLPGEGDQFGFSLALSDDGNTLAVGAPSEDSSASGINGNQKDDSALTAGAVYVYARTGTTWAQQAYIKSDTTPMATAGDQFGYSVALNGDGNTLAVGVYDEGGSGRGVNVPIDTGRNGSGAVYVYSRKGPVWTREAYLKTWNSEGGDSWGVSVALSGDGNTLAVGAQNEDSAAQGINGNEADESAEEAGAVYVFAR